MKSSVRRNCFYPSKTGVNYITVGFVVRQALLDGRLHRLPGRHDRSHWSKGWIIEDCEVSDSSAPAFLWASSSSRGTTTSGSRPSTRTVPRPSVSASATRFQGLDQGKHRPSYHPPLQHPMTRPDRCRRPSGRGVFSIIEDNHIHHINNKQNLSGTLRSACQDARCHRRDLSPQPHPPLHPQHFGWTELRALVSPRTCSMTACPT